MNLVQESLLILGGFLLLCSGWLVNHFASPGTSLLIKLLVTCSFTLGTLGIALLPIDLTITDKYDASVDAASIVPNATYIPWVATYWSTFFLAWTALPLFRESLLSGQFSFCSRLRAGCREAIRGYIFLLVVAVSAVLFLAIKLHSWHVIPVLMALGNTYGLLMVSLLLGYGLVDLPRKMWAQANPKMELRRTHIMASNADEAVYNAVWELQDCEALVDEVASKAGGTTDDSGSRIAMDVRYSSCLDKLLTLRKSTANLSPDLQRRRASPGRRCQEDCAGEEDDDNSTHSDYRADGLPDLDYLVQLNARLEAACAETTSTEQRWNSLVAKSRLYSDLIEGTVARPIASEPPNGCCGRCVSALTFVASHLRYIWLVGLRSSVYRVLGLSCAALSAMVLWSEATLAVPMNLSPFVTALDLFQHNVVLFQLAAMLPLLYMSICVYSSLFKLSLFGRYRLRGVHQSQGVALVFNAQYLVRLQFPLGYNYLFLIKYDTSTTNCAFSHVMSNMSTVPFFGTSFSVYAPLLILALCAFTLCNGYARVLALLGFEHEDAILLGDPETLDGKVNEGIKLLERHTSRVNNSLERGSRKSLLKESRTITGRTSRSGNVNGGSVHIEMV